MENKYYTPAIEDLHVGYEYEYRVGKNYAWNTGKIFDLYTDRDGYGIYEVEEYLGEGNIRTPYLTKEQIEAEGWMLKAKSIDLWFESDIEKASRLQELYGYKCYKLYLNYGLHDHKIIIKGDFNGGSNFDNSDTLFEGFCPSINEYRTICKLLNIN